MFIYSKKIVVWDVDWPNEPREPHILMGWGSLLLARPESGCLGIARNMGNWGADAAAPTGTSEPVCLRQSIQASMASI